MHEHAQAQRSWQLMQDGVVYGLFNSQGGPRGGHEVVVPNWWMGMLTRQQGSHQIGFNAMLSLDPWTAGKDGYREIFQVGEALDGKPLVDRQHPHDLFMQLAASWRTALSDSTSLVIAGGPVGEPTLGPVAFMHRPSAAGLALAPLGHHTFDSTHLSFGVVTAAVERGPWVFEGSLFNAREPDDNRWDIEFGAFDSVAGRVWYRPSAELEVQVSSGRLREPEELVAGDDPHDGVDRLVPARRGRICRRDVRLWREFRPWRAPARTAGRVHRGARRQLHVRACGYSAGRDGRPDHG